MAEGSARELKRLVAGERLELELVDADAFDELTRAIDGRAMRSEPSSLSISLPVAGGAQEVRALLVLIPTGADRPLLASDEPR